VFAVEVRTSEGADEFILFTLVAGFEVLGGERVEGKGWRLQFFRLDVHVSTIMVR
jgi:hypothetical protein